MTAVVCISHGEDVDGLASAALVRAATGATVQLADYGDMIEQLEHVSEGAATLYICDLGLSERLYSAFYQTLDRLHRRARIVYIDHHPLPPEQESGLRGLGIELVRDLRECTGVQVYGVFEHQLPARAAILPGLAAVTDYLEDGPRAQELLARFDRHFLFFEAMVLTQAISGRTDDRAFTARLVEELAQLHLPDEMPDIPRLALEQTARIRTLLEAAPQQGRKLTGLAYMEGGGISGGTVANTLIGLFRVPVGVAYRRRNGAIELSVRAHPRFTGDLGQLVGQTAKEVDGYGGGHPRASGARIPQDRLDAFLTQLDARVRSLPPS